MSLPDKFPDGTKFFDCAEGFPVTWSPNGDGRSWAKGEPRPFSLATISSDGVRISEDEFRALVMRAMSHAKPAP